MRRGGRGRNDERRDDERHHDNDGADNALASRNSSAYPSQTLSPSTPARTAGYSRPRRDPTEPSARVPRFQPPGDRWKRVVGSASARSCARVLEPDALPTRMTRTPLLRVRRSDEDA